MASEYLYEVTQPDGPLDLRILVEMGPTAYGWRQRRLVFWGTNSRGYHVNEEIRDRARIVLFLKRLNALKKRKHDGIDVRQVWHTPYANAGVRDGSSWGDVWAARTEDA